MNERSASLKNIYRTSSGLSGLKGFTTLYKGELDAKLATAKSELKLAKGDYKKNIELYNDIDPSFEKEEKEYATKAKAAKMKIIENKVLRSEYRKDKVYLRIGYFIYKIRKKRFMKRTGKDNVGKVYLKGDYDNIAELATLDVLKAKTHVAAAQYRKGLITSQEYEVTFNTYYKKKIAIDKVRVGKNTFEKREKKIVKLSQKGFTFARNNISLNIKSYGIKNFFQDDFDSYRLWSINKKVEGHIKIQNILKSPYNGKTYFDVKVEKKTIDKQKQARVITSADKYIAKSRLPKTGKDDRKLASAKAGLFFKYIGHSTLYVAKAVIEDTKKIQSGKRKNTP